MKQDEFTKLFTFMQKEFNKINTRLDETATKQELNTLTNAVDAYAKQADTYMQELLALSHKVDRLERWINQIAEKTGVRLTY
jgi:uncharacterized coiled-coil DUF342 family protein